MSSTKIINPLPSTVKKPCGSVPGRDDSQYPLCGDGTTCGNPASYAVEVVGVELLVCGVHRRPVQRKTGVEDT